MIIIFSGKKQAGKSSGAKAMFAYLANKHLGKQRYEISRNGDLVDSWAIEEDQSSIPIEYPNEYSEKLYNLFGIKLYSFADPLKDLVSRLFDIELELMYGTDNDKNTKTHILWDDMPNNIRVKYSKPKKGTQEYEPASGKMTIRELLQVFGTDICRQIDGNCWARALYDKIAAENYPYAFITDARFPNEITIGTEMGGKAIRLKRSLKNDDQHPSEIALDDFPEGEFTKILDNSDMTLKDKNKILTEWLESWI